MKNANKVYIILMCFRFVCNIYSIPRDLLILLSISVDRDALCLSENYKSDPNFRTINSTDPPLLWHIWITLFDFDRHSIDTVKATIKYKSFFFKIA